MIFNKNNNCVELLAPAGSVDSLKGAIAAGADAVYIGGRAFGARAFADNPSDDELLRCIDFCHLRSKKLYLTVNTLLKEEELFYDLYPFIEPLYSEGLDAVIVQDEGVMRFFSECFPKLPIHVSTQASLMTATGASYFADRYNSVERFVPARELSLNELKRIKTETDLEVEVFIHGALCYCYSGQCLMSSCIGSRSGNRGRCAQPCRKLYENQYLLSPKDLCSVQNFDKLLDIGIDSFKIEGRMKSPQYTAGVVSVYRELIDDYYECLSAGKSFDSFRRSNTIYFDTKVKTLQALFNRGGFTDGYFTRHNSREMMSLKRPNHSGVQIGLVETTNAREAVIKLTGDIHKGDVLEIRKDDEKALYEFTAGQDNNSGGHIKVLTMKGTYPTKGQRVFKTRDNDLLNNITGSFCSEESQVLVDIKAVALVGSPLSVTFSANVFGKNTECTVYGDTVEEAKTKAMSESDIAEKLCRLGDTHFSANSCLIESDGKGFIPVSKLNSIRREAAEQLTNKIISSFKRTDMIPYSESLKTYDNTVNADNYEFIKIASVQTYEQLEFLASNRLVSEIYLNIDGFDSDELNTAIDDSIKKCSDYGIKLFLGLPYICRYETLDKVKMLINNYYKQVGFIVRNREELVLCSQSEACDYHLDDNIYIFNSKSNPACGHIYSLNRELTFEELKTVASKDSELVVYGYRPVMFSAQCVYKNLYGHCHEDNTHTVVIKDELGHSFVTRQCCEYCYNIIYNSACLDLRTETEKIKKLGIVRYRYDFTFESIAELEKIISDNDIKSCNKDKKYTYGHFINETE